MYKVFCSWLPAVPVVDVEDRQGGRGWGPGLGMFPAELPTAGRVAALESLKLSIYVILGLPSMLCF